MKLFLTLSTVVIYLVLTELHKQLNKQYLISGKKELMYNLNMLFSLINIFKEGQDRLYWMSPNKMSFLCFKAFNPGSALRRGISTRTIHALLSHAE